MTDWDDGLSSGTTPGPAWVSAADAADKVGTTPGRVREWAREGLIASQPSQGPTGEQVLVRLEEVIERARGESGRPHYDPDDVPRGYNHVPTAELSPIFKTIPELVAQLTSATDRAARAETKVEFLARQVGELKRQLSEVSEQAGIEPILAPDEGLSQLSDIAVAEAESSTEDLLSPPTTFAPFDEALGAAPTLEGQAEDVPVDETQLESDDSLAGIWAEDTAGSRSDGSETPRNERGRVRRLPDPPRRRRWWSRRR